MKFGEINFNRTNCENIIILAINRYNQRETAKIDPKSNLQSPEVLKNIRKQILSVFHPDINKHSDVPDSKQNLAILEFFQILSHSFDRIQNNDFKDQRNDSYQGYTNRPNTYTQDKTLLDKETVQKLKQGLVLLEREVLKIINNIIRLNGYNHAEIRTLLRNSETWQRYFFYLRKAEENLTTQSGLNNFNRAVDIYNQFLRKY